MLNVLLFSLLVRTSLKFNSFGRVFGLVLLSVFSIIFILGARLWKDCPANCVCVCVSPQQQNSMHAEQGQTEVNITTVTKLSLILDNTAANLRSVEILIACVRYFLVVL